MELDPSMLNSDPRTWTKEFRLLVELDRRKGRPASNRESELIRKRNYYHLNRDREREKGRERKRLKKLEDKSFIQIELARESHREAQERYREKNRLLLNARSRQYRSQKKVTEERDNAEADYQRFMASEDDSPFRL